jgi:SAM-dependent methyltransferase
MHVFMSIDNARSLARTKAERSTRFRVTSHTLDAGLRYRAVFALLEDRWCPGIRVLEVGSGSGGAAEWTDEQIVGVDIAFDRTSERKRPNLIEHPGSVTAIPMPDASFDVVLCLDMLEHVPPGDRPQAIAELTRVLAPGGRLLLTFPSGPAAEALDRWLAATYTARHGKPHPWAAEHLGLGLPDANEIAALARASGVTVVVQPNVWVPAWRFLHGTYTVGRGLPFTWPLFHRPAVTLVYHVLARLNRSPAYRAILIVDRPRG